MIRLLISPFVILAGFLVTLARLTLRLAPPRRRNFARERQERIERDARWGHFGGRSGQMERRLR